MGLKNSLTFPAVVACAVLVSGCVPLILGAAAGAVGIAYVKGEAVRNLDKDVKGVHKAALAALKDLGIFIVADEVNVHSASVKGEYADGPKVFVKITGVTDRVSRVSVRVGAIGDQQKSYIIMNAIEERL